MVKKCYVNLKSQNKAARKLGYAQRSISKSKPKNSVKISETSCFHVYAKGNKDYLVAKKGYKIING